MAEITQKPVQEASKTPSLQFSSKEAIRFGWETTKKNLWFFIGLFLLAGIIGYGPSALIGMLETERSDLAVIFGILSIAIIVLQILIEIGLTKISINFVDGKESKYTDLFTHHRLLVKYFVGHIIYGIVVLLGFLLLIIPGIYFALKYQFYSFLIVDKGISPIDAIKKSAQMTKGIKMQLIAFSFVLGAINLLGFLALLVGLFVTIPTTMLAQAYVYRKLKEQAGV